jgi:hypothetical protein
VSYLKNINIILKSIKIRLSFDYENNMNNEEGIIYSQDNNISPKFKMIIIDNYDLNENKN